MSSFIDLSSKRFGWLIAVEKFGRNNQGKAVWICKCDCGNTVNVTSDNLKSGNTKSCGCYTIKHGNAKRDEHSLTYKSWDSMIQRCTNPNVNNYDLYGGKGISVYQKWIESFEEFLQYMGPRPSKHHSIDRKNSSGNYEPGNVRWATRVEQSRNTGMFRTNTSGVKGVSKFRDKWQAYINAGKKIHLGTFENIEEAITAREKAEEKYWGKSS